MATTTRHVTSAVPSIRGINASVPASLESVVYKALAKDPAQRFGSVSELILELRSIEETLRFGRNAAPSKPKENLVQVESPSITRKLSPETKAQIAKQEAQRARIQSRKRSRKDRDVSPWALAIIGIAFVLAVAAVVGFFVMLAQKPREVKVPMLVNLTVENARKKVAPLKLSIREFSRKPSESMDLGRILETSPVANERVKEGGVIDVIVSTGSKMVDVPDLIGMTGDEARVALAELGLKVDGKPTRTIDTDLPPGQVLRQIPPAGKRVERFSLVRLWIASPPNAPLGSLPGEREDTAASMAKTYKLNYKVENAKGEVMVKIDFVDNRGGKRVYQQSHSNGDLIKLVEIGYGVTGTFRIFYDTKLNTEMTYDREGKLVETPNDLKTEPAEEKKPVSSDEEEHNH
jgi:hypothetical protein